MARVSNRKTKEEGSMINLIKKIWAGPFAVKASLVFLLLVVLITLLGNPGIMIFTIALVYSVFSIIDWISKEDE
jgi:hypothetical protein